MPNASPAKTRDAPHKRVDVANGKRLRRPRRARRAEKQEEKPVQHPKVRVQKKNKERVIGGRGHCPGGGGGPLRQ